MIKPDPPPVTAPSEGHQGMRAIDQTLTWGHSAMTPVRVHGGRRSTPGSPFTPSSTNTLEAAEFAGKPA